MLWIHLNCQHLSFNKINSLILWYIKDFEWNLLTFLLFTLCSNDIWSNILCSWWNQSLYLQSLTNKQNLSTIKHNKSWITSLTCVFLTSLWVKCLITKYWEIFTKRFIKFFKENEYETHMSRSFNCTEWILVYF